jgi:serine protease Do
MVGLAEIEDAARAALARAGVAVVGVSDGRALGSGVVVAAGRVLTNAHNLHAEEVTVTLPDGRSVTGRAVGADRDGDLAVVAVDTSGATPIPWAMPPERADAALPEPGAVVFALANPGGRGLRVTFGLVSATGRSFRGPRGRLIAGSIEHTAPLPRGASGGPIVDVSGGFLALNTHRLGNGFYLALPADRALRERVDRLAAGETPTRARLGIGVAPAAVARRLRAAVGLPEREGLLVGGVEDNSPAARAGLRRGDLIVTVGERTVTGVDELHELLDTLAPDARLQVHVVRGVEELSMFLDLDDRAGGSVV